MDIKRPGSFGLHAPEKWMSGGGAPKKPADGGETFREDYEVGSGMLDEQARRDERDVSSVPTAQKPEPDDMDKGVVTRLLERIKGISPKDRN